MPRTTTETPYQRARRTELERLGVETIGDLNNLRAPSAYVHYFDTRDLDQAVLRDTGMSALCGHQFKKAPSVSEIRRGNQASRDEFCPLCWVLNHGTMFGRWH